MDEFCGNWERESIHAIRYQKVCVIYEAPVKVFWNVWNPGVKVIHSKAEQARSPFLCKMHCFDRTLNTALPSLVTASFYSRPALSCRHSGPLFCSASCSLTASIPVILYYSLTFCLKSFGSCFSLDMTLKVAFLIFLTLGSGPVPVTCKTKRLER